MTSVTMIHMIQLTPLFFWSFFCCFFLWSKTSVRFLSTVVLFLVLTAAAVLRPVAAPVFRLPAGFRFKSVLWPAFVFRFMFVFRFTPVFRFTFVFRLTFVFRFTLSSCVQGAEARPHAATLHPTWDIHRHHRHHAEIRWTDWRPGEQPVVFARIGASGATI